MNTQLIRKNMDTNNICDCDVIDNDKVEKVEVNGLHNEDIANLSSLFKVLGDNTRVRIITSLAQEELCVCDLSVALNMTKSAVNHQLKKLKDERQVKSRKEVKNVYYSLDDEHIVDIVSRSLEHIKHK